MVIIRSAHPTAQLIGAGWAFLERLSMRNKLGRVAGGREGLNLAGKGGAIDFSALISCVCNSSSMRDLASSPSGSGPYDLIRL